MRKSSLLLIAGLVAATGLALAYGSRDVGSNATNNDPPAQQQQQVGQQDMQDMQGQGQGDLAGPGPVDPNQPLPPNHPAINGGMGQAMGQAPQDNVHGGMGSMGNMAPDESEPPALTWKAPASWASAPNPNPMRVATYKIPHAAADKEDTELVVARAGGDVSTNVARWASQFDGSPAPAQTNKTVHGLKVTVVQIEGTFQGGMGPSTGAHPGWAMLGAIVETKGMPYFFKIVGPAATVKAAKAPFDAMIDSFNPS